MSAFVKLPSGRYVNLDGVFQVIPPRDGGDVWTLLWTSGKPSTAEDRMSEADAVALIAAVDAAARPVTRPPEKS